MGHVDQAPCLDEGPSSGVSGIDYNFDDVLEDVSFASNTGGSAILDDPQKRCKQSFSNTKKAPIEKGTSALTKVGNLAKDDDCPIIDVEAKSELNAHCMNEHICVTFADKDPSVIRKSMFAFQR
ncbi:hypothetical protein Fot_06175 [Forsythia ovata]|uniref:Uncharacterized protein n=1 Tax=Forsythia ovata TaxID=205694 RepID=A0ABD1WS85_9LAMI